MPPQVETPHIKYVFTDVVGFTRGRSAEAQADVVHTLNEITNEALRHFKIDPKSRILLPSGDGICVAFIQPRQYDLHLQFALELLRRLQNANSLQEDERRKFSLRVGINENTDNVIRDINRRRNIAGAGINLAQRVMDCADAEQVLIGQPVHTVLVSREKYMDAFREFSAIDKHGQSFTVFQFILKSPGLNIEPPKRLAPPPKQEPKLSGYTAYFIAHAMANREALERIAREGTGEQAATVALHFMTEDSLTKRKASRFETPILKTVDDGRLDFLETCKHYDKSDLWLLGELVSSVVAQRLETFSSFFESGLYGSIWILPKKNAIERLKKDFPSWWSKVESGKVH
jgi:class 3 adenylate cyclase